MRSEARNCLTGGGCRKEESLCKPREAGCQQATVNRKNFKDQLIAPMNCRFPRDEVDSRDDNTLTQYPENTSKIA
jgi:hypothetical protein